ncbi:MAG TPA: patatin-like phospholipase family protein, partial [Chroococcales cyanobacterium]
MKRSSTSKLRSFLTKEVEVVLGAGGMKGYGHIGALRELIAAGVRISMVTGVSVGTIVAAFLTNGYSPDEILEAFEDAIKNTSSGSALLRALSTMPDPISASIGGIMDLYPGVQDMVKRYNLKPNPRLRIVACDLMRHQPVVFEGEDYDLAHAIAASCSLPGLFRSQWHTGKDGIQLLVDGAVYHYNPTEF